MDRGDCRPQHHPKLQEGSVLGSPDPRIMAGPGIGEGKHGKSQGHHDTNKAPQRSAEEGWARGGATQSHVAEESWGELGRAA